MLLKNINNSYYSDVVTKHNQIVIDIYYISYLDIYLIS